MAINFSELGGGGGGGKFQKTEIIKSTQSWTAPADVTEVEVILCGGGGGGGAAYVGNSSFGYAASGGGGSMTFDILTVTPSSSYTITIGAGGSGAPNSNAANGSAGSSSSFGALLSIAGGGFGTPGYSRKPGVPAGLGGAGGTGAAQLVNNSSNTAQQVYAATAGSSTVFGYGAGGGGGGFNHNHGSEPANGSTFGAGTGRYDNTSYGDEDALPNTGAGGGGGVGIGSGTTDYTGGNGGSGVCVIKYWTAG